MRVSRHIAEFLKSKVEHVFGLQGGAVVHLFDACERFGPKPVYCHHEQGAGFAMSGYARVHGYGACIVTTGPGGTNAITPLLGLWQDSIPCMFISGQVRAAQMTYKLPLHEIGIRQGGMQESPIKEIVYPICKRAYVVRDAAEVPAQLEKAYAVSKEGRPGPVWIDVPLDLQWTELPN